MRPYGGRWKNKRQQRNSFHERLRLGHRHHHHAIPALAAYNWPWQNGMLYRACQLPFARNARRSALPSLSLSSLPSLSTSVLPLFPSLYSYSLQMLTLLHWTTYFHCCMRLVGLSLLWSVSLGLRLLCCNTLLIKLSLLRRSSVKIGQCVNNFR